jgi:hypothetical protein
MDCETQELTKPSIFTEACRIVKLGRYMCQRKFVMRGDILNEDAFNEFLVMNLGSASSDGTAVYSCQ